MSSRSHPLLILIRGLPGSGKSYLAGALGRALAADSPVLLDPDATDYGSAAYQAHVQQQEREGVDPALYPYRFLRAQAYAGIEAHQVIIWNQPFTDLDIFQKMTDRLNTHATEHGTDLAILVVEVGVDPAVAQARVTKRKQGGGHGPSAERFARFVSEYETAADRGYQVVAVRGDDDVDLSVQRVLEAVQQLG